MRRRQAAVNAAVPSLSRWWLAALLGAALALLAGAARSASPPAATDAPGATPPAGASNGVIAAPSVDPGITAKPPAGSASLPTPIIPPPGSPGGDPKVVPK